MSTTNNQFSLSSDGFERSNFPRASAVLSSVVLALVLAGTLQGSSTVLHAGGVVVLAFAAVGMYLYFDSASKATGGPAFPLGRPLLGG